jgi:hypothetical protein
MKKWMLAFSLLAVLGFYGIADACKGKRAGVQGKVMGVGQGHLTLATHTGRNRAVDAEDAATGGMMMVHYDITTTVNGGSRRVDGSLVGRTVSVIGAQAGNAIHASSITVLEYHHRR